MAKFSKIAGNIILLGLPIYSGFELESQVTGGIQTGLSEFSDTRDSYESMVQGRVAPMYTFLPIYYSEPSVFGSGEFISYLDFPPDYEVKSGISLRHSFENHFFEELFYSQFTSQSSLVDLDEPFEFTMIGVELSYKLKKRNSFKLAFKGDWLMEQSSPREDFKISLKPSFTLGLWTTIYPGIGVSYTRNYSNQLESDYWNVTAFPYTIILFGSSLYAAVFVDFGYRQYDKNVLKPFPNKRGKVPTGKGLISQETQNSQNTGFHVSLSKEWVKNLELLLEYDFYLSNSTSWEGHYRSHSVSCGGVWNF